MKFLYDLFIFDLGQFTVQKKSKAADWEKASNSKWTYGKKKEMGF